VFGALSLMDISSCADTHARDQRVSTSVSIQAEPGADPNVLIIDDGFASKGKYSDPVMRRKWLYTAVTCACRSVIIRQER
jgi:hypothetical protein